MHQPDYEMSVKEGQSPERALQNSVDAAMRGYTVGQWPKEAVDQFFNPKQRELLDGLKDYMISGKTAEEMIDEGFKTGRGGE